MNDFKNSKKFWEFYKSSIKIRSDKSQSKSPNLLITDNVRTSDPEKISNLFNGFFTSIESISLTKNDKCIDFIDNLFNDLKKENRIRTSSFGFSFVRTSEYEVKKFIKELTFSSPGTSGINSKVLKLMPDTMVPIYTKLFNYCIVTKSIPDDWKSAIVTPLFKNKGESTDLNNYRGISVLSPISKIFEKILASQISNYFEEKKLFTIHQHGFRKSHSCETALHELISDLNSARDKKLTTLLLFIDFKKAFDTVDSSLLLSKLHHYGFDTEALILIADYFKNRLQVTKINNHLSSPKPMLLGVPQGSILGPLFFLIFINDLLEYLPDISSKLFADDTTLYCSSPELTIVTNKFSKTINQLLEWCSNNRLDVNWTKTFFMVVTNKRLKIPESFTYNNIEIKCVKEFKLLGITIDYKLTFNTHISNVASSINSKLFSIKRIFYLSTSVKVQFFKTFILPYFDYCSTLSIYFSKAVIQRLCNKYFLCLNLLSKLDLSLFTNCNELNDYLQDKYNIPAFQHRLLQRLSIFSFKMLNFVSAPKILKEIIETKFQELKSQETNNADPLFVPENIRSLRNRNVIIYSQDAQSKFFINTFSYFSQTFLKCFKLDIFNLNYNQFFKEVATNINNICTSLINHFAKFNLVLKCFYLVKDKNLQTS